MWFPAHLARNTSQYLGKVRNILFKVKIGTGVLSVYEKENHKFIWKSMTNTLLFLVIAIRILSHRLFMWRKTYPNAVIPTYSFHKTAHEMYMTKCNKLRYYSAYSFHKKSLMKCTWLNAINSAIIPLTLLFRLIHFIEYRHEKYMTKRNKLRYRTFLVQ